MATLVPNEFSSYEFFSEEELALATTFTELNLFYLHTLRSAEALQKLEVVLTEANAKEHGAYLQGKIDILTHLISLANQEGN